MRLRLLTLLLAACLLVRPVFAIDWISVHGVAATANNFTGCVGGFHTTSATPITITGLCRYNAPSDALTHTIYYLDASGNHLGTASVDAAMGTPDTMQCAALAGSTFSPAVNTKHYAMSSETNGGDSWGSSGSTPTVTAIAVLDGAASASGGCAANPVTITNEIASAGNTYGPSGFQYTINTSSFRRSIIIGFLMRLFKLPWLEHEEIHTAIFARG